MYSNAKKVHDYIINQLLFALAKLVQWKWVRYIVQISACCYNGWFTFKNGPLDNSLDWTTRMQLNQYISRGWSIAGQFAIEDKANSSNNNTCTY